MLMGQVVLDNQLFGVLADYMRNASICGLGQAAFNLMPSLIKFFPDICPWPSSRPAK